MRTLTLAVLVAAIWGTTGCRKTGEGEYEVQRPAVGVETDTVNTPSVDVGTRTDTLTVPDVDVDAEKKEVKVPTVDVDPPKDKD